MNKLQQEILQKPQDYIDPDKVDNDLISGSINDKVVQNSSQ